MSKLALMWEAKAAPGLGPGLLEWARARTRELAPAPVRLDTLTAEGDRVLVITWWDEDGAADDRTELPDPPEDLVARPVHRWRFQEA